MRKAIQPHARSLAEVEKMRFMALRSLMHLAHLKVAEAHWVACSCLRGKSQSRWCILLRRA